MTTLYCVVKGERYPQQKVLVKIKGGACFDEIVNILEIENVRADADNIPHTQEKIERAIKGKARKYKNKWLEVYQPMLKVVK